MIASRMRSCILAAILCLPSTYGHHHRHRSAPGQSADKSEIFAGLNSQSLAIVAPPVPLTHVNNDDLSIKTNTTIALPVEPTSESITGETIDSTALVIARDLTSAYSAYSGLNDRGIPYSILVVPETGEALPILNDTATHGNFGLIVIMSEVSYNYGSTKGFQSALTPAQWQQLYNYQVAFGVRMVRLDVAPSATTGTQSLGSCCGTGVQLVSISNSTLFPGAGLKVGAGVTTKGLYHYPAKIINSSMAFEIAQFSASAEDGFNSTSTAAVINEIDGRQQMVFYLPFNVQWSLASNLLQHAWVHWATRGLYVGYRRATLSTQVDDMFLQTPMFDSGENFRVSSSDLSHHVTVMKTINKRLPAGSKWVIEVGHNGNGNIEAADPEYAARTSATTGVCAPGPIEYADQFDTPLEYQKPVGTGTALWPETATDYANYSSSCMKKDELLTWWQRSSNLNAFSHVSHTFTHEDQNNATYSDVFKEISWNRGWLDAVGISAAKQFSSTGIIPPAITGLHNGDALQAWADNGIVHVVGDNTRKVLLNPTNEHWPLTSTRALNGFPGIQITPRWASNIYYNASCNYADCVLAEWKAVSNGTGDMYQLLDIERETNVRHLLGLHHDPFMFHQANMMFEDADTYDFGGDDISVMSLLEVWVDVVTREYTRLVTWPLVSQKHDDIAAGLRSRMIRDNCRPTLTWQVDSKANVITVVTVAANRNTCSVPIPVTFPGTVTDQQGSTAEQLGNDPLTLWVSLTGKPVSFTLTKPVPL
ncbi:hypothetical protein BKA61DRAFT_731797 [Leptodontidium sp. MPI-SDFR-AT-0119]|nr:hypothetical protein BKA61DRAFT_731797 [Leptodontidium sp. MPI-SDFR-AT-0119]